MFKINTQMPSMPFENLVPFTIELKAEKLSPLYVISQFLIIKISDKLLLLSTGMYFQGTPCCIENLRTSMFTSEISCQAETQHLYKIFSYL